MYTIIPTHPALKHLKQIFKKNAKYTKLTTLLIVTRKGAKTYGKASQTPTTLNRTSTTRK